MSDYQKTSNVYDQLLIKGKTGIINQDFSDLVVEGGILAKGGIMLGDIDINGKNSKLLAGTVFYENDNLYFINDEGTKIKLHNTSIGSGGDLTVDNLTVKEKGRFNGDVTIEGRTDMNDVMTDDLTVESMLQVIGKATLNDTLNVSGDITVGSNLEINGTLIVNSAASYLSYVETLGLTVHGITILDGDTTLDSNLTVGGTTTLKGDTTLDSNLTVGGTTTLKGVTADNYNLGGHCDSNSITVTGSDKLSLINQNITPATYGSDSNKPIITVNEYGIITNISSVPSMNDIKEDITFDIDGNGITINSTATPVVYNGEATKTVTIHSSATADATADTIVYRNSGNSSTFKNITVENIDADFVDTAILNISGSLNIDSSSLIFYRKLLFAWAGGTIDPYPDNIAIQLNPGMKIQWGNTGASGTSYLDGTSAAVASNVLSSDFPPTPVFVTVPLIIPSDIRVKTNIKDLNDEDTLKLINDLEPVSYLYKNDEEQRTKYGFLAQELKEDLSATTFINKKKNSPTIYKLCEIEINTNSEEELLVGRFTLPGANDSNNTFMVEVGKNIYFDFIAKNSQVAVVTKIENDIITFNIKKTEEIIKFEPPEDFTDYVPLRNILDKECVTEWKGEKLTWNKDTNGIIMAKVLVTGVDLDDMHTVDLTGICALNVSAIQQLTKDKIVLETKVESLEERLAKLEALILAQ